MGKIGIVGAGIGGIGAAIRFASQGHEVHVFEKNNFAGGKVAEIRTDGFRFDMGPSLFTLPELVTELFELAGENPEDFFAYERLDTITRYFFTSGKIVDAFSNLDDFIEELNVKLGESPQSIKKFFSKSEQIYNLTKDVFIFGSFHTWKTFLSKKFLRAFLQWWKLDATTTMQKGIDRFLKTKEGRQLYGRYATYNGSSPFQAPGTLNVIPHLEHKIGAFFPNEGMYSIVGSLVDLAERKGVNFHFDSEVERILLNKKTATGLEVNGEHIAFDTIISDVDVFVLYKRLLPEKYFPKALLKHERSTSALIFYWGMNRQFPQFDLHNILFSDNYEEEFNHLFKSKTIFNDPTVYIFISSKKVIKDAPAGKENWFVMINAPATDSIDWNNSVSVLREIILKKIKKTLKEDVRKYIETEEVLTPKDIETRTNSHMGALYGISSNSRMSAFARHANFSSKLKNIYFVGGSVHPGGGIPLCLASARIVDQLFHREN